jgi:hypothetical protein
MRADMAQVIIERPRWGSALPSRKKGYRKALQRIGFEELPRREPLLGRWKGRQRSLNENLSPLERFLRSRVGRPWNHVHRELCSHLSFDNPVQSHLLDHLDAFVHRQVMVDERGVVPLHGWYRGQALRTGTMYVCPTTGLLKAVRRRVRSRSPRCVVRGPLLRWLQRDGEWWEVRLAPLSDHAVLGELWDVWFETRVSLIPDHRRGREYGVKFFALSKRASSRETCMLQDRFRPHRWPPRTGRGLRPLVDQRDLDWQSAVEPVKRSLIAGVRPGASLVARPLAIMGPVTPSRAQDKSPSRDHSDQTLSVAGNQDSVARCSTTGRARHILRPLPPRRGGVPRIARAPERETQNDRSIVQARE